MRGVRAFFERVSGGDITYDVSSILFASRENARELRNRTCLKGLADKPEASFWQGLQVAPAKNREKVDG